MLDLRWIDKLLLLWPDSWRCGLPTFTPLSSVYPLHGTWRSSTDQMPTLLHYPYKVLQGPKQTSPQSSLHSIFSFLCSLYSSHSWTHLQHTGQNPSPPSGILFCLISKLLTTFLLKSVSSEKRENLELALFCLFLYLHCLLHDWQKEKLLAECRGEWVKRRPSVASLYSVLHLRVIFWDHWEHSYL